MPSRVRRFIRRAVDRASGTTIVRIIEREVADIWRKDDRLEKKLEAREARSAASYAASELERGRIADANATARLQLRMGMTRQESRLGNPGRGARTLGEVNGMNRMLGGGA